MVVLSDEQYVRVWVKYSSLQRQMRVRKWYIDVPVIGWFAAFIVMALYLCLEFLLFEPKPNPHVHVCSCGKKV